ncbi:YibE/F family protein [Brevibacterium sp. p3-SID960]|uniref:YibE/F family protein n=1 Tax=Brevibacterium sp. p3-SID960 TaxID=2916063 RepID=UPI0021A52543|nr:YibE/F family protein [Brevibacterium sp. p3-SID960]MCT1689691.1 YibE/F family protein [Brevibacterium sp. p3-SID960]
MHYIAETLPRASRQAWSVMLGMLIPLAVLSVVGLVWLWPSSAATDRWDPAALAEGAEFTSGTVESIDLRACPDYESTGCGAITLDTGERSGTMYAPPEAIKTGIAAGDRIKVIVMDTAQTDPVADAITGGGQGSGEQAPGSDPTNEPTAADFVFVDFDRTISLGTLAFVYAALVILVAGLKGLRALIGLALAYAVMVWFMLPAVMDGKPAVLVGITAAAVIMFIVLYLAHGFSARTTTALLGTLFGILITGVLGALWTDWSKLAGIYTEETYILAWTDGLSMADLVVCAILIAGLGVLNDVTITQAAAVWELAASRPEASRREIFTSAMRIGRDHIASTVYTIAFAHAGGALTVLLLVAASSRPFLESLTLGEQAISVVSTLVTSIGLVIAIPATTLIAVLVVRSGTSAYSAAEP